MVCWRQGEHQHRKCPCLCKKSQVKNQGFGLVPKFLLSGVIADDLCGENYISPGKKLEDLIHLAELCVDLLQQNEEHYAEVSSETPPTLPHIVFSSITHHAMHYIMSQPLKVNKI